MESRTQGSRPKPKTQKNFEAKGQGQTLSRPRPRTKDTDASVLKKSLQKIFFRRKRSSKFFFRRSLLEETKKRSLLIFRKVSGAFQRNFNGSKIVLSESRGQGNFRGLEASRPRPMTTKCVLEAKDVLINQDLIIKDALINQVHNKKNPQNVGEKDAIQM